MTWFLRESEWNHGTSRIAKKLLDIDVDNAKPNRAILFVRMGRGEFLCCGHCRVAQHQESEAKLKDYGLEELYLDLLDWKQLQNCVDFTSMAVKREDRDPESSTEAPFPSESVSAGRSNNAVSPSRLAEKVIQGNVVEAMALALLAFPENEKSIGFGLQQLKEALHRANETSQSIELALLMVKDLPHTY